jgi:hypothetical protein
MPTIQDLKSEKSEMLPELKRLKRQVEMAIAYIESNQPMRPLDPRPCEYDHSIVNACGPRCRPLDFTIGDFAVRRFRNRSDRIPA